MDMEIQVQIMHEHICISHDTNTLGKCMNVTNYTPAMFKIAVQTEF